MISDEGKYAVITGARSGIGLATLRLFAKSGISCLPVIHNETKEFLEEIDSLKSEFGVSINPLFMDLSDENSIKEGCNSVLKNRFPVEILVNAVGIKGNDSSFLMTGMSDIKKVFDVNFFNILFLSQLISRMMMRKRKGSIVNVTSIAAFGEDTSQLEYASSKVALECASRKMARELAPLGIRVNCVAPGWTMTSMVEKLINEKSKIFEDGLPFGRLATPEEVAQAILFLADDKSSYISGSTIRVDGGGFDLRKFVAKS